MATKRPRPRTSFEVLRKQVLGTVELSSTADDSPGLAAFRLIDQNMMSDGEDGEYEFTIPDGITVTVTSEFTGR